MTLPKDSKGHKWSIKHIFEFSKHKTIGTQMSEFLQYAKATASNSFHAHTGVLGIA